MKPIKPMSRKLTLNRESLRQLTPRPLSPAQLAQVVGGAGECEEAATVKCTCVMTSEPG